MGRFGVSHIFKNEVVGLQGMYPMYANFRCGASSFFIKETLPSAAPGEGLAWESCNVYVYSALWVNMRVLPCIGPYFQGGEVFPNECSGFGPKFGGADENVRDAECSQGL